MIALARLLTRLVGVALLALAAVVGLLAAVFCIQGAHGTLSLASLAGDLHLPALRGDVNGFLNQITAGGSVALIATLCGAGCVLLGPVLLVGAWRSQRPRRVVLAHDTRGSLAIRRRPLSRLIAAEVIDADAVAGARVHTHAYRRRDGGRVRIRARAAAGSDGRQARSAARAEAISLGNDLPLNVKVRARRPTRHDRSDLTVSS